MDRAFGIDVSRYDGALDFFAVTAWGVEFIAMRSTISWGYKDPFFLTNWPQARARAIPRMAYHVLYPGEPARKQADNLEAAFAGDFDTVHDRVVIDAELEHDCSRRVITDSIFNLSVEIERRFKNLPLLYSRTEWLNRCVYGAELSHLDLWLAQYLKRWPWQQYADEHPGPPDIPTGFTDFRIHQTGDKTPTFCAGPVEGRIKGNQDYDRFNGDRAAVRAYFSMDQDAPPPAPAGLVVTNLTEGLNIRSGPSINYLVVGKLQKGAVRPVLDVSGAESWVRISEGWIARNHAGVTYSEVGPG